MRPFFSSLSPIKRFEKHLFSISPIYKFVLFSFFFLTVNVLKGQQVTHTLQITNFEKDGYKKERFEFNNGKLVTGWAEHLLFSEGSFLLNFDEKTTPLFRSDLYLKTEGYKGDGARFITPENKLVVNNPTGDFFEKNIDTGSFSISFYYKPENTANGQILLKKWGPVIDHKSGEILSQGFLIEVRRSRIACTFDNFFHFKENHRTVSLIEGTFLEEGKWYHIIISFDEKSGKLTKSNNGVIEDFVYVTMDGTPSSTLLYPHFLRDNNHPLIIGDKVFGTLDEILIKRGGNFNTIGGKYLSGKFFWESRIFELKEYSRIRKIIVPKVPSPGYVECYARISSHYFPEESESTLWHHVAPNVDFSTTPLFSGLYGTSGKYLQLKIVYIGFDTLKSTEIGAIGVELEQDMSPLPIEFLAATALNQSATLEWIKSTEPDIEGYIIYVRDGNRTKEIVLPKESALLVSSQLTWGGDKISYHLTGLENDKLYHISISCYDRLGETHRGIRSRQLEVLPHTFAGLK